jgi:hypothetical protein
MSVCLREQVVHQYRIECVRDGLALMRNWRLPTNSWLLKAVVRPTGRATGPIVLPAITVVSFNMTQMLQSRDVVEDEDGIG